MWLCVPHSVMNVSDFAFKEEGRFVAFQTYVCGNKRFYLNFVKLAVFIKILWSYLFYINILWNYLFVSQAQEEAQNLFLNLLLNNINWLDQ